MQPSLQRPPQRLTEVFVHWVVVLCLFTSTLPIACPNGSTEKAALPSLHLHSRQKSQGAVAVAPTSAGPCFAGEFPQSSGMSTSPPVQMGPGWRDRHSVTCSCTPLNRKLREKLSGNTGIRELKIDLKYAKSRKSQERSSKLSNRGG